MQMDHGLVGHRLKDGGRLIENQCHGHHETNNHDDTQHAHEHRRDADPLSRWPVCASDEPLPVRPNTDTHHHDEHGRSAHRLS